MRQRLMASGVALAALCAATAAPAATFTFNTTSAADGTAASKNFVSVKDGYTINMRATGWRADTTTTNDYYTISSAQLGTFTPGLGVLSTGESYSDAEHQIDNIGGVDFVMLQFSEAVSLSGIGRTSFAISAVPTTGSDASYRSTSLGSAANWNQAIDLSKYAVYGSTFTPLAGTNVGYGKDYKTDFTSSVFSSTWLVGAGFSSGNNDGFKISSVNVNFTPPAVPEPATWAMMVVGFGAVGSALRSRKRTAGVVSLG